MDDYSDFMSHEIKRLGIDLEALPTTLKFLKYLVPSLESKICLRVTTTMKSIGY